MLTGGMNVNKLWTTLLSFNAMLKLLLLPMLLLLLLLPPWELPMHRGRTTPKELPIKLHPLAIPCQITKTTDRILTLSRMSLIMSQPAQSCRRGSKFYCVVRSNKLILFRSTLLREAGKNFIDYSDAYFLARGPRNCIFGLK